MAILLSGQAMTWWLWIKLVMLSGGAVAIAAFGARAQDQSGQSMSGAEIQAEFVGRRLAGIYPHGTVWSETVVKDGTTDYLERGVRNAGRWRIEGNLFCFSYARLLAGGCFEVIRLSPNCFDLYAWPSLAAPTDAPRRKSYNGKMWLADQPATCDDKPIV
ncbi:MAG TPA: hypothetical protein PK264_12680 [Hyphomicrobiaceae bacterium]|nr:hypothetical protein [Hyphomicrobiaceae bacterium]